MICEPIWPPVNEKQAASATRWQLQGIIIAGTGLTLGANHGGPFADPAQGFTQIATPAYKGDLEIVLVHMMRFVGRCQHFTLVDKIVQLIVEQSKIEFLSIQSNQFIRTL